MKIYSIQFLRALAAILVVYCHSIDLEMKFTSSVQENFYFLQNFGAIGVDIFFVISGFIISYVGGQLNGKRDTITFLRKRFIRINPIYYLFSFVAFVLITIFQQRPSFKAVLKTITILPLETGNLFKYPILTIGWTLSFEWFFYLLFSVLILASIRWKEGILFIACLILVLSGILLQPTEITMKFATNPLILEFAFGALVGWWYRYRTIHSGIAYLSLLTSGVWLIFLLINGYSDVAEADNLLNGPSNPERLLLWGIPSALLIVGCVFLERNGTYVGGLFKTDLIQLLGDASYAIYLAHPIVFYILHIVVVKAGYYGNGDIMILIQVVIAVFLGTMAHIHIEKKLINKLLRFRTA